MEKGKMKAWPKPSVKNKSMKEPGTLRYCKNTGFQ